MRASHRSRWRVLIAGVAAIVAMQAQAADQALIDAAKKEGAVTWYTTLVVDQIVRPAAAAFERKYGIKVDYVRADPNDELLRILAEDKAGRTMADFFDGFGFPQLVRAGLVASYLPEGMKRMSPKFYDPAGYWISTNFYVLTTGFNTDLVKKNEAPNSYEALLDPRWRGKLAWSSRQSASSAVGFIGGALREMGEEKGEAYLRRLAMQDIVNVDGSARQLLDQVMAGEYPMALQIFNHHAVISASQGAPVDWARMEPSMVVLFVLQAMARAPHPNAARLMLDFLSSPEGQEIFHAADYLPVDPDLMPRDPNLRPEVGKFRVNTFTPDELEDGQAHWLDLYKRYFR
jgi:ABC-type Fe3+ transport system substrate-binding protein